MVIKGIIAQFAEESAFLWAQRTRAVDAPHFSLHDLARLDERLEAQIDGLRVAGEAGWDACAQVLGSDLPGDCFAPAILALESGMPSRVQAVLDAIGTDQTKACGLISAFGWIPGEQAAPQINSLLASEAPFQRYIGMAATTLHRRDPGHYLDKALVDQDPLLNACALRAVGVLGSRGMQHVPLLQESFNDADEGIRFAAAWSAALLGDGRAVEILRSFVEPASRFRRNALNLAARRLEPAAVLAWQQELARSPETVRLAIIGAGATGSPALVPWLIAQMAIPDHARAAGEAFTMITGVDLEREGLAGPWPDGFECGPNDDPEDDSVEMDPDGDLPWPNAELVAQWWDRHQGAFEGGARYLLGRPITGAHLSFVLQTGLQRHRAAAALELAIMQPGRPLFDVRAPGFRQRAEVQNA